MKKITLSIICGLLFISFANRSTNAQTPTSAAGTVDSTFTPGGKFNAQFFGDLFYKMHADTLGRGSGQYSGGGPATPNVPRTAWDFQIRRIYLGYNYDISKSFTTEFLLAYEEGNIGGAITGATSTAGKATLDIQGERSVYVKLANIQWKNIYSNATLVFGAQATPGYVFTSEAVWGYRSIEKTLTDKNGIIKSSDLGLGLRGAFNDARDFGYDLLLADGTGQTLPNVASVNAKNKKLYVDLWGKFMDKKIVVQAYFDDQQTSDLPLSKNSTTLKFFAAYATTPLTIGAELFMQTNTNAVADSNFAAGKTETVSSKPFGFSVFATAQIVENCLNVFARYDSFDPDNNYLNSGVKYSTAGYGSTLSKESFIVAGLDWTPYKNVHIMPNIWYDGYSNKNTNLTDRQLSDNDIVPRLTFFYKF
ncbi:MAG: hypothetical protein ACHQM6_05000 [Candidatus Kapaibacterium sp.]